MLDIVNHYQTSILPQAPNLDLFRVLAVAGIIGVVYQFQTPVKALVLRIRPSWQRNLIWVLSSIGLLIMLLHAWLFGDIKKRNKDPAPFVIGNGKRF
jgi:hypothetical protein